MEITEIITVFFQLSNRNILLLSIIILIFFHLITGSVRHWRVRTIPGPFPWPVIGNAAQIGKYPHIYFTRMAQYYGNVFQIKLGNRSVVVLNGNAIRKALVQKGVDFAGRPDFASFRFISGGRSVAFNNYSEWWKVHRRVAQTTVRKFTSGSPDTKNTTEKHVVRECKELISLLLRETSAQGYFQPHQYLVMSMANIVCALCFGKRYAYDDAEFLQVVGRNDKFTKTVGAGSIVDVMPWLQYFPNPIKTLFDHFKDLNAEFYEFILTKVVEHRKTMEPSIVRDMTDVLIMTIDRGMTPGYSGKASGVLLDENYVPPTIGDIFGASQDTTSTALQWIVMLIVRYPDIQRKLQEEVDKVVGRNRLPTLQDQPNLSYVMAFIYEMLRFSSFIPLTIPHSTTKDTCINGYSIPKDTVVFINQWSLNHDPKNWDEPEIFNPLRFLDEDGELNKDVTGNVVIFSMGKRRCIGEELSKMHLFLFTTLLTHQCYFTADKQPTMDCMYGLTLKPNPFQIAVSMRD